MVCKRGCFRERVCSNCGSTKQELEKATEEVAVVQELQKRVRTQARVSTGSERKNLLVFQGHIIKGEINRAWQNTRRGGREELLQNYRCVVLTNRRMLEL